MRLSEQTGASLQILWFRDAGLGCRFSDLFCLLPSFPNGGALKEATWTDVLLRDRSRLSNLFFPSLVRRFRYDRCIDEYQTARLMTEGADFASLCRDRRVWMASYVYFLTRSDRDIPTDSFDPFRPVPSLQERIDAQAAAMGHNVVGVHIRRTDNVVSIQQSPTALFEERMSQEPADTIFYLATDSEEVKMQMRRRFGERVQTLHRQAERGTLQGMQDALVELYLLARCRHILGSAGSTFSMTAASIGRVSLEILCRS